MYNCLILGITDHWLDKLEKEGSQFKDKRFLKYKRTEYVQMLIEKSQEALG